MSHPGRGALRPGCCCRDEGVHCGKCSWRSFFNFCKETRGPQRRSPPPRSPQVRQFVVSLNGVNVLDLDYRTVSHRVLTGPRAVVMEVMEETDH